MVNRSTPLSVFILSACTSAGTTDHRVAVGANELGVATVEVDRSEEAGDSIFVARGLDGNDGEIASVRIRTGHIADLPRLLSADLVGDLTVGSEITTQIAGHDPVRTLTRATKDFTIIPNDDPKLVQFLSIPEVATALAEGRVAPYTPPREGESALSYVPYTYDCSSDLAIANGQYLGQCCYTDNTQLGWYQSWSTWVLNYTVYVTRQGRFTSCRSALGGSCAGEQCFSGPNGFARANMTDTGWYTKVRTNFNWSPPGCGYTHDLDNYEFGSITGSFPTGCGCCGNGNGQTCADRANVPNGTCIYSYADCNTCGGGGSGGGQWDM